MRRSTFDGLEDENDVRVYWRPIAFAVLAAVLAAATFAIGFRVGRTTAPSDQLAVRESPPSATTAVRGAASRLENEVPIGYPQTVEGSVTAATNFAVVLGGPLILRPDRYRAAVSTMSAPSWRDRRLGAAEDAIAAFQNSSQLVTAAARGATVVVQEVPVAYRVASHSNRAAQISVWALSIIGADGLLAPQENWGTADVSLEWVGNDWKLTDLAATAGPYPALQQYKSPQTTSLPPQLKDYRRYAHAPGG